MKPLNVDAYKEVLLKHVIPDIKRKWYVRKVKVVIQQDNAPL